MSVTKLDSNFGWFYEQLLDPLSQSTKKELKHFFFSHPAVEDDVYSFSGDSDIGVHDTFSRGNWREHFNTIPEPTKEWFGTLMDQYKENFAWSSEVRRPVMNGDKIADLDFDLVTDRPIFVKPYPLNPKLTER